MQESDFEIYKKLQDLNIYIVRTIREIFTGVPMDIDYLQSELENASLVADLISREASRLRKLAFHKATYE